MNMKLNDKIIKNMCGTVSFKRGDSFYRANKVTIEQYSQYECKAIVSAMEEFFVTIKSDDRGEILTECSCPKLASFRKDCQHIAAVLLAIYDQQNKGTTVIPSRSNPLGKTANQSLSKEFLEIFNHKSPRSSAHQLHFEDRQVIEAEFTCRPIQMGKGICMFAIEISVGKNKVEHIRDFLEKVKARKSSQLSTTFTYDPSIHCFEEHADKVIGKLVQVVQDEKMYVNSQTEHVDTINRTTHLLLIPPSNWEELLPLLQNSAKVNLAYGGYYYDGLCLSDDLPPIQFHLTSGEDSEDYYLKVKGLESIVVVPEYRTVLSEGTLIQMKGEDCNRLSDVKQMLDNSSKQELVVPREQKDIFLEKVVPGLKRLGTVHIDHSVSKQLGKIKLVAKLYLDRVKARLLAGLEFHYEHVVINPLENNGPTLSTLLIRDVEKEQAILELMEESLFSKTESGYFLHNEELEYNFLYNTVPKLQKNVQIYATTAVRNRLFRGSTHPKIRVKVKKERTNWLEFKFEMDGIPERQIKEILQALEEKRKYYRLRNGSLLSLETREFEEMNRFMNEVGGEYEDLLEGLNVPVVKGFKFLDSVDDNPAYTLEESFLQFLEQIRNPAGMNVEIPQEVDSILRDYQKHGYKWMKTLASYGFGGILADDMGLGKTLQSIAFILSELSTIRQSKTPVLIVCPSSLTYNWLHELMKFASQIESIVMDGNKTERVKLQQHLMNIDVVITSYPLLRKDIHWFEKQTFHAVFFDEAQAFKNPVTQTSRAVKKIQADYRFALTGTPIENSLEELWAIFHVVFPELFHSLKEYSHLSRKTIARRIRPFLLRRLKEDVLEELPKKIEMTESSELLPEQKKLYAAYLAKLRHDTLKHLDKDTLRKNRIKILAGLTRLRQICCHPSLFVDGYKGSSAKFEQLLQIVDEAMLTGRRVLIFSQFTKMLEIIGRELSVQGLPFFYLDGQTRPEERVKICSRFNEGERSLFLISLKAGGTGLNLTGADTVVLYDIWWNPAVEEQAADRAHRIGQRKKVEVIKLVARGTIEEKIDELQEKKRHLVEEVIESDGKVPSSLTEEDIRDILMLKGPYD
ncbi:DEAD/DEAH box helicase [Bacillus timonensis]|nr:DEAD/DEAH box helicase [Bacillus timonensis]